MLGPCVTKLQFYRTDLLHSLYCSLLQFHARLAEKKIFCASAQSSPAPFLNSLSPLQLATVDMSRGVNQVFRDISGAVLVLEELVQPCYGPDGKKALDLQALAS